MSSSQPKTEVISLPGSFFTDTVSKIQDLAELKAVLYTAYLLLRKQNSVCPVSSGVTYRELKAECRRLTPDLDEAALLQALNSAVEHGTLLHSKLDADGVAEDVYSLAAAAASSHELAAVSIFTLYEQNIGIITPMVAEELKEAEKFYPHEWVEEAFKEAVVLNKRSWKYIARILERWAIEGKDSGEHKGHAKKVDPDKYIKGKYGHMVRR